jgi:hypothetical protein
MTEDTMGEMTAAGRGDKSLDASGLVRIFCIVSVLILLVGISACSKHQVPTVAKVEPIAIVAAPKVDSVRAPSLTDSLIGKWKIRKTEIDNAMDKMTTFGSQTERDELLKKQTQYQEAFLGLTTNFKSDSTFQSVFSGQSDIVTWRVTRQREIETVSKVTDNASIFKIRSISERTLVVNYDASGVLLVLTFDKQ